MPNPEVAAAPEQLTMGGTVPTGYVPPVSYRPAVTTFNAGGKDIPIGNMGGMYVDAAAKLYGDMNPATKATIPDPMYTLSIPPGTPGYPQGGDVQVPAAQLISGINAFAPHQAPTFNVPGYVLGQGGSLVPMTAPVGAYEQGGLTALQPTGEASPDGKPVFSVVPNPNKTASGLPDAAEIAAASTAFTNQELGGVEQSAKTDKNGNVQTIDIRMGGPAVTVPGLNNLPSEYPRKFQERAAQLMSQDPKWVEPATWPDLAKVITGETLPVMPEGYQFGGGKFTMPKVGPGPDWMYRDDRISAENFFRDKILPQLKGSSVGDASWAKVKKMADDYGLSNDARARLGLPPSDKPVERKGHPQVVPGAIDKSLLEDAGINRPGA